MRPEPAMDIPCAAIVSGLRNVLALLESPTARDVFEIDSSCSFAYAELKRLRDSLEQYMDRERDLFYVGLLGHFSCGKTSTINSILELWHARTGGNRETGLSPTDKAVSLITHPDNLSRVIALNREGEIPVRTFPSDTEKLKRLVLMDTPGSGDPQHFGEMLRDILPICDLVLFTFSAAAAFDEADIPLLERLQDKLPFIPKRAVVTRADEFFLENHGDDDGPSVDNPKLNQFLGRLLARLKLAGTSISKSEVFFVDNPTQFGIIPLADFIDESAKLDDVEARILLRDNKVQFFLRLSREYKAGCQALLDSKRRDSIDCVNEVKTNIDAYHQAVEIATAKLAMDWQRSASQSSEIQVQTLRRMHPKAIEGVFADHLRDDASIDAWFQGTSEEIKSMAESAGRKIASNMHSAVHDAFAEQRRVFNEGIAALGRSALSEFRLHVAAIPLPNVTHVTAEDVRVPQRRLPEQMMSICERTIAERYKGVVDTSRSLGRMLADLEPLTDLQEIMENEKKALDNEMRSYFLHVDMYLQAVFAARIRKYIESLHLGRHLDEVSQATLTVEQKSDHLKRAHTEVFGPIAEALETFRSEVTGLHARVRETQTKIQTVTLIRRKPSTVVRSELATREEIRALLVEAHHELKDNLEQQLHLLQDSIQQKAQQLITEHHTQTRELRRKRVRRFALATGLGGLLSFVGFLLYSVFTQAVPNTVGYILGFGILSNAIGDLVGLLLARVTDPTKRAREEAERKTLEQIRATLRGLVNERLGQLSSIDNIRARCTEQLLARWTKEMPQLLEKEWNESLEETYGGVRELANDLLLIHEAHQLSVKRVTESCRHVLQDEASNAEKLGQVAEAIKQDHINPTFSVLEKTISHLSDFSEELAGISFT